MSGKKETFTLSELEKLVSFNKAFLKVVCKRLQIDSEGTISESDAERIAKKLKRPWPPAE